MIALAALLRVEARELRRHAGRSWLLILLVALPVAAMVGGSALLMTARPTAEERCAADLGSADLRVEVSDDRAAAVLARELPSTARSTTLVHSVAHCAGPGEGREVPVLEIEPLELGPSSLLAGLVSRIAGEPPTGATEVALSSALARALGCAPGDPLTLDGETVQVRGIVQQPERLTDEFVLRSVRVPTSGRRSVLVSYAEPVLLAARLRALDFHLVLRAELGMPDAFETIVVFVAGGFGFFECALVIAAAFAVGLRRRQREIGLLGACGAERRLMRTALCASAVATASLGALLGLGVGMAAALAAHPWQDEWNGRANGPLEFPALHLCGAVVLGLLAALGAAVIPAFGATRLSIRAALGGRRPITEGSRTWLLLGLLALLGGAGVLVLGTRATGPVAAMAILGGAGLAVLGFGATSPALLGALARLAGPLPLPWRLAVREAGRFRARNGPVVTAILAGMSVSVMLAVFAAAIEARLGGRAENSSDLFLQFALGACLVTGLVIVFIATTLSAVESAADAQVLHTLGADPRLLRSTSAARAGYLAALGAWLAIPAGLLPAYGLLALAQVELRFSMPWSTLATVAIGLPTLAFAGAWLWPCARPSTLHRS